MNVAHAYDSATPLDTGSISLIAVLRKKSAVAVLLLVIALPIARADDQPCRQPAGSAPQSVAEIVSDTPKQVYAAVERVARQYKVAHADRGARSLGFCAPTPAGPMFFTVRVDPSFTSNTEALAGVQVQDLKGGDAPAAKVSSCYAEEFVHQVRNALATGVAEKMSLDACR